MTTVKIIQRMIRKKREDKFINASDFVTVTEAAQLRGVSRAAIHELVQRGRLRYERMFGRVLLYKSEVLLFEKDKPGPKTEKSNR